MHAFSFWMAYVQVSATLSWFAIELIADIVLERWDDNVALRGKQLRELTSRNGPAFIKVYKCDTLHYYCVHDANLLAATSMHAIATADTASVNLLQHCAYY
jgi:hypothetical protein